MLPYQVQYTLNGTKGLYRVVASRATFARAETERTFPGCVVGLILPGVKR